VGENDLWNRWSSSYTTTRSLSMSKVYINVDDREEPNLLDSLYKLNVGKWDDYINTIADGSIRWRSIQNIEVGSNVPLDDCQ